MIRRSTPELRRLEQRALDLQVACGDNDPAAIAEVRRVEAEAQAIRDRINYAIAASGQDIGWRSL